MNTLKAFSIVMIPVFVTVMIFNATVLNSYIAAKKLENMRNIKRSPALVTSTFKG